MLNIQNYVRVKSLEEAFELNQKKTNVILGGMMWLRMGNRTINTAIDLSELGLDQIEETENEFIIGCMTSLRSLEVHEGLNRFTCGSMKESLRHIVGVQFRNTATVGGSLFGRFGFSDILTEFLTLGAEVELYKAGRMPLETFAQMERDNDILVRIYIRKIPECRVNYQAVRNQSTDFPILTCAVAQIQDTVLVSVGARPAKAVILRDSEGILKHGISQESAEQFADFAAGQIKTGSNDRGSAEYRTHLIKVLVTRGLLKIKEEQV